MTPDEQDELRFTVSGQGAGQRLDKLVAQAAQVSRRIARTWISAGRVSVNDRTVRILTRPLKDGALVRIGGGARPTALPTGQTSRGGAAPRAANARRPDHAALAVLFHDRYLIAIDKPAGLLSEHDRFGSPSLESLVPAWLEARGERPGIWLVHRLDAGTSGVIVVARTPMAVERLGNAFRDGTVGKEYLALCRGVIAAPELIDAPIAKAERTRHQVAPDGKPAVTQIEPLGTGDDATLIRARPRTGRTHQIRVHLAHRGHPLFGDRLYGGPGYGPGAAPVAIPRPMLHAARLTVPHPKTGARLTLTAPPPSDFVALAIALRVDAPLKPYLEQGGDPGGDA